MRIANLNVKGKELLNISSLNIIMGRNGAGKSRFMRAIEEGLHKDGQYNVRYICPERGGSFSQTAHVLTSMEQNPDYLTHNRRFNQTNDFKSASAKLLRDVEINYLRKVTQTPELRLDLERTFEADRLEKINRLLSNITLTMGSKGIKFQTLNGDSVLPQHLSSGESETVSLTSEILYFFDTLDTNKFNLLLLDEPDVHLHPDLQARLGNFILNMLDEYKEQIDNISVCISTHSTPLICSLASSPYTSIGTKIFNSEIIQMKPASEEVKKIAPFFGHPLSLALSEDVPLIVEGDDDERVWQQAARSSRGVIKVFPVQANTVNQQSSLETFAENLLTSIYDHPIAFSLRDGDDKPGQSLQNCGPVQRFRLNCYSIENLLLTDQCLSVLGTDWETFKVNAQDWLNENGDHKDTQLIKQLIDSPNRLQFVKIKSIRQLICAICKSQKPWEVVVGQAIGKTAIEDKDKDKDYMLINYIGEEAFKKIVSQEFDT